MKNKREWIFTFGIGHPLGGHYIRFSGDFNEARQKMFDTFGDKWAFQYSAEEWAEMEKDPEKAGMLETDLFESVNYIQALYERMCKTCTRAVQCHEECTECDEFRERLESEGVHKFRICGYYYMQKLREIPRYLNGIEEKQIEPKPVEDAIRRPVMTEEVREAIMRLSMCAREECSLCKYEESCCFDKQVEMATENMNTILAAFTDLNAEQI